MRIQAPVELRVNLPKTADTSNPLSKLSKGDSVSVRVTDVSDGRITLKTQDGQTVKADNFTGTPVQEGDNLTLEVQSRSDGRLTLRLTSVNGQETSPQFNRLEVRLNDLGIQTTPENLRILSALEQSGASVSREAFAEISHAVAAFSGLTEEVAAFAFANKIPLNADTVPVLTQWLENPASLANTASEIQNLAENAAVGGNPQPSFTLQLANDRPLLLSLAQYDGFAELADTLSALPELPDAEAAIARFADSLPLSGESSEVVKNALLGEYVNMAEQTASSAEPTQTLIAANNVSQSSSAPVSESQSETVQQVAADILTAHDAVSQQTAAQSAASQEASGGVQQDISAHVDSFLGAVSKLFIRLGSGEQPAAQLERAVASQNDLTNALQNQAHSLFGSESAVARHTDSLNSQVQLTSNLQNFTYCQIPLQFHETRNTAELYVFENKKRSKKDAGQNYTVLVALDTQNMGRVETVLRLNAGQLDVEFRVENEQIRHYFSRSAEALRKSITSLSVKQVNVQLIKTPVTPQNAMSVLEQAPFGISGINIEI